jgi:hypothetical protein
LGVHGVQNIERDYFINFQLAGSCW